MLLQTVSFLTYLLKSYADYIRPHEESICKSIVNLLVTCSDSVSIRKVILLLLLSFFSLLDFFLIDLKTKMLDAGTINIPETCPWNRFQERFISSY